MQEAPAINYLHVRESPHARGAADSKKILGSELEELNNISPPLEPFDFEGTFVRAARSRFLCTSPKPGPKTTMLVESIMPTNR